MTEVGVRSLPQRDRSSTGCRMRFGCRGLGILAGLVVAGLLAGGCGEVHEKGWACPMLTQVQFYAPPGASVVVKDLRGTRTHQINPEPAEDRLERLPDQFGVFHFSAGWTYEFMYTAADGLPGATIYGELEVPTVCTAESRAFIKRAFVPVSLLSDYYDPDTAHYYPAVGPSGAGLSALELEHLREGDLITKVYFVADLQRAWETIRGIDFHVEKLRSAETVLNADLELVDARYESYRRDALYADPTADSQARSRDSSGASQEFVRLEARRQKLENSRYEVRRQVDDLLAEKRIRTRLLDTMKIINRRGALVLATPESQWDFHNTKDQVSHARSYDGFAVGPWGTYTTGDITIPSLGEPVLVMRVGGRHRDWDEAYQGVAEGVAYHADDDEEDDD